jgi:tripartite-type tricarboxylate transporter receptor subunit TctC
LKEVLAAARAKPGELNYGNHGDGTTTNYMGEKLKKVTGVEMVAVPYTGDGPILVDLLGGHLKTGFLSGSNAKKAAESGRARMIAVASTQRSPLLPSVPTFGEAGIEGFDRESWGKLFVPIGTPAPVVDKMARDVSQIVRRQDVQERFAGLGLVGKGGTPAETLQDVQADYVYWIRLIKEFGLLSKP